MKVKAKAPGPGNYGQSGDQEWNKRTFNITYMLDNAV